MKNMRKIYVIDNQNYLIDTDSHRIYDVVTVGALKNGRRIISINDVGNNNAAKVHKWGCVNENFEEVIPCIYAQLSEHSENVFDATMLNPTSTNSFLDKYFYFLMDEKGVPIYFHHEEEDGVERELVVRFDGFVAISKFKKGLAVGLSHNNKQGVLRSDGSILLEPQYDYIQLGVHHIFTRNGDSCRTLLYIDDKKDWRFVPHGYSFKEYNKEEKCFILNYEDRIAVMDLNANLIILPIYKKLRFEKECIIATNVKNKSGVLEKSNPRNILVDFEYDNIESFCSYYERRNYLGYLKLIKNGKQGVYSLKKKRLIVPICFNANVELLLGTLGENMLGIYDSFHGEGFVNVDGSFAFWAYGKILHGFRDGVVRVYSRNSWVEYDKSGNIVKESEDDSDDTYEEEYREDSYTEEDVWDAMTDGMYGDYPGGGVDYDALGF